MNKGERGEELVLAGQGESMSQLSRTACHPYRTKPKRAVVRTREQDMPLQAMISKSTAILKHNSSSPE